MTSLPPETDLLISTAFHWGAYLARVRDGRLIALEPHPLDPDPSPIGRGIVAAVTGPARIARPMVRKSWLANGAKAGGAGRGRESFIAVPWDEALDLAARALSTVRDRHGPAAIFGGSYGWASAGRFHHAQSQLHRFLNQLGGYTAAINSYSKGALEVILPHVVGDSVRDRPDTPSWQEIARQTELVVAFGGLPTKNAQVFAGGIVDHSARAGMEACRNAGVAFVNIGPQRDDIDAVLNPAWISIRPNTDAAVMLALAHVLITDDGIDHAFLETATVGYARLRDHILNSGCTPAWAANIAGCNADDLIALARRMAKARTLITVQWSVQRGDHGEQPCWLAVALAAMAGSMGRPGGGVGFGFPRPPGTMPPFRIAALPQGRNAVQEAIPVARIADALINPGGEYDYNGRARRYPDLKLIYWAGGNPFHHHQDLGRLIRAWRNAETIVVHDPYWTAAARHADIVFPATTALERNDIGWGPGQLMAMHRAIAPFSAARSDFEIFTGLAVRLGFGADFTENRDEMTWVRHLYEETRAGSEGRLPDFETFWQSGVVALPETDIAPAPFAGLRERPGRHLLLTPSGKIELYAERIATFGYDDAPGHGVWIAPREWREAGARYPLQLISNQPRTRLHSQYDMGSVSLAAKVAGREPLRLHPKDAAERGITSGDTVRVFNDRGAFLAGAIVSDDIRAGVVQIATGAWFAPLDPASPERLDLAGNPNVVTRDLGGSKLTQATSAMSCRVEIEKFKGIAPRPDTHSFATDPA